MIHSPLQDHFNRLVEEIQSQSPPTLALWRLQNQQIFNVLERFGKSTQEEHNDGPDEKHDLLNQTLSLFDELNPLLAQQEMESGIFAQTNRTMDSTEETLAPAPPTAVAVVFGGKYSSHPRSISELLVSRLAISGFDRIWTVSRSQMVEKLPSNITHVTKQNLDQPNGKMEYQEVLDQVLDSSSPSSITIFFTLGQHIGISPFQRNLQASENFASALAEILPSPDSSSSSLQKWKVIVTGTDATQSSTHPDGQITIDDQEYTIPTYRISEYNYTYALSKLGQYYRIGQTIATLTGKSALAETCTKIVHRISQHVEKEGDNVTYDATTALVKMEELDEWSRQVDSMLLPELKTHYFIAKRGISICYTPLHATPWSEQALLAAHKMPELGDPRAYILEQVMKRLKNAISIDQAVSVHLRNGM